MGGEAPAGAGATAQGDAHRPAAKRPPGRTGALALLEVLRAPLLLSPISDVAAGWAVTTALIDRGGGSPGSTSAEVPVALFAAATCGVCLLGAGMAQNALADRADDAARKPDRPLPRGAVSVPVVAGTFTLLTLGALGASLAAPGSLPVVLAIVILTAAYHLALKPLRLAGCVTLGTLRGLDMLLGAAAAAGGVAPLLELPAATFSPLVVCGAYGLYITGASLHASTDDEPGGSLWSRSGLLLDTAILLGLGWAASAGPDAARLTALLFAYPIVRLLSAWRRLPPAPLTGVALSNMYLLGAGVCFGAGNVMLGALALALFFGSRRLMRVFPPS